MERLRPVDFDESIGEFVTELKRRHLNTRAEQQKARVLAVFRLTCQRNACEATAALLPFYASMRRKMVLAASTSLSYLKTVIVGERLRGPDVQVALKVAEAEAATADPVSRLVVPQEAAWWSFLTSLPAGPIRRTLAVITATGCRVADANKLRAHEVRVRGRELTIAWSRMKQRRSYRHRVTIDYPSLEEEADHTTLLGELAAAAAMGGQPFSASVAQVNLALRRSGLFPRGVTSRSLRVRFVALVAQHVRVTGGGPGRVAELTGHHSDAMASAVYRRHAALQ